MKRKDFEVVPKCREKVAGGGSSKKGEAEEEGSDGEVEVVDGPSSQPTPRKKGASAREQEKATEWESDGEATPKAKKTTSENLVPIAG